MRLRLTLFFGAMLLAVSPVTAPAQDAVAFGIAEEPNPPFTIKDASGSWTGWEVDIRDAVCRQMTITCTWVDTSWDDLIPALKAKRFDVIWSSLPITDERRKSIDFTERYYTLPVGLVGTKDAPGRADREGLRGKIVGVLAATTSEVYANANFRSAAKLVRVYQDADAMTQDLAGGRIDSVLADAITAEAFLQTDAGRGCCKLLGMVADDPKTLGQGFAGGLRKDDAALRDKINDALKAIRASGEFAAITRRYFPFELPGP